MPILYEVTATIADPAAEQPWLRWMLDEHIADVVRAGADRGRVVKLDGGDRTYLAQYEFADRAALDAYLAHHAPRLRADGAARFSPDRVRLSRRVGEILTPGDSE